MKSFAASAPDSLRVSLGRAALVAALTLAGTSLAIAQSSVNPDPEIFDGTRTKTAPATVDPNLKIDDWESAATMILIDAITPDLPGMGGEGLPGIPGGGAGMGTGGGLPGVGMGAPGVGIGTASPPAIPTGQQPGAGAASTPGAGGKQANTAGAAASANKPSDVSIGDASQRIKTTAQGQAGNTPGTPEGGEKGGKEAGEDSTEIPSSASVPQSGTRGGGVETGDAMPPDM